VNNGPGGKMEKKEYQDVVQAEQNLSLEEGKKNSRYINMGKQTIKVQVYNAEMYM